jgi:hypothetical protein
MESNQLLLTKGYPEKPTFFNHNKMSMSQIDYIMHQDIERHISYKVCIYDMEPLNVSDHTLVIAELKGEIIRKHRKLTTIMKRPNWRKCDEDLYKETLVQGLSKIEFDNS